MDDRAASNPLSFIVAGSLIIAVIGLALTSTDQIGGREATSSNLEANRETQAEGLLSLLVDAPPQGTGTSDRLSLKAPQDPALDITTFRNLQRTKFTPSDATLLYYDDARAGLGIDGMDFHIRSYPTLQSVRDALNSKDENLNVVYIGHVTTSFAAGSAPTIDSLTCSTSPFDSTDTVRYTVGFTNTGTTPTQFQVVMEIKNGNGKGVLVQDQSGLVPDHTPGQILIDVPNTADNACLSGTTVDVDLYGTNKKLANRLFAAPVSGAGSGPSATLVDGLTLTLREQYYHSSDTVTVEYIADKDDVLKWKLYANSDLTVVVQSGTHVVPHKNHAAYGTIQFTAPSVASATGYTIVVEHQQHSATMAQRLLLMPTGIDVAEFAPVGSSNHHLDPAFEPEVDMITQLIERFRPEAFDGALPADYDWPGSPGDVYYDQKQTLTGSLPDRIKVDNTVDCNPAPPAGFDAAAYPYPDVIVVGSNVDHQAMTSGPFKLPLADWVACGGLLIVFGSPDGTTQWLQPIFHVGDQQGTGGIAAPDMTHPILRVPNTLDFEIYENHDLTWKYTGDAANHFTNIVNQGADPVTALSDVGDFGRGTVLISQWLPYDVFGTGVGTAGSEGKALMDNFLTQAYRDLFLDYGPPIPSDSPVLPAIRQSQIELSNQFGDDNYHPMCKNTGTCHVDMTVLLYLF